MIITSLVMLIRMFLLATVEHDSKLLTIYADSVSITETTPTQLGNLASLTGRLCHVDALQDHQGMGETALPVPVVTFLSLLKNISPLTADIV